jgi:hypothetical protein
MVEAIQIFEVEAKAKKLRFPGVDLHWLMQNFVRMMTTQIFDYFIDYERA